jgi:hypothetical protein
MNLKYKSRASDVTEALDQSEQSTKKWRSWQNQRSPPKPIMAAILSLHFLKTVPLHYWFNYPYIINLHIE